MEEKHFWSVNFSINKVVTIHDESSSRQRQAEKKREKNLRYDNKIVTWDMYRSINSPPLLSLSCINRSWFETRLVFTLFPPTDIDLSIFPLAFFMFCLTILTSQSFHSVTRYVVEVLGLLTIFYWIIPTSIDLASFTDTTLCSLHPASINILNCEQDSLSSLYF